jgi:ABC-2 type transport system permease protein
MTAELGAARTQVPVARRIIGLGSIYGKTMRDSRRAILLVAGFMALLVVISGAFVASQWPDVATRAEGVALTTALPAVFTGLYGGAAISPETLGGFTNWRYGLIFFVLPGVWSLIALSGTLTTEMRRGSMDLLAALPAERRRIAVQKLGAHVTAMTVVMVVFAIVVWAVGAAFATLPGDEIPVGDAAGYALLMWLAGLAAGTIAFALAIPLGRGAAAGIAALFLVGGWLVNGFGDSLPLLDALSPLSWASWTAGHRPIAGIEDWASLIPLAAVVAVAAIGGVLAFERRDIGAVGTVRLPALPPAILGTSGPLRRAFGERFSTAMAWGIGIGVYALIIASSSADFQRVITETPSLAEMMRAVFPDADLADPGFGLQLLFVQFGTLAIGFAAAALVGGWASDESEGRLELLLATPVARTRWLVESALGTYGAILLTSLVAAVAAAAGVILAGGDPWQAMVGSTVLVLYGTALAGIGIAVGGLVRPSLAAPAVIAVVVGILLIDILAPLLELPEWVGNLALSSQYGEPMVGNWDPAGVIASLVLATGGVVIGAIGFARRDLQS